MSLMEVLADMPDERDRALAVWRRALGGELVVQTLEFGDPLHHRRWYSTQHAPIRDAAGAVVGAGEVTSDITELVEAQGALRRSEARWNAAIESFAEGAIIATANEQVIYWNPAAREMHGYSHPDEGIGPLEQTPETFQLWTPDGGRMLELDEWPMRRIRRGEPVRNLEFRVRRPDQGWEKTFAYSGTMVETSEGERLIFLTCQDLTELRRAERALLEADQRKTEFLAILAHELRNPLAPIRNATHILKRQSPDDPVLRAAQDLIERQVKHMVRLIDDLLDVSRITRGRLELRRERVELATVLDSAIESVRPYLDQATQVLSVSLPAQPVFLDGDFVRLTQVFLNVIHNASKYTDREQGRIALTAELDGPVAIVRVRDNGLGIAAECLPSVFDLFSQVDAAAQKSPGGLGIGLALSRGIVQLHGGSIEATSAGPGQGSEFIVRLPVLTEPVASGGDADIRDDVSPRGGDLRILVVDDNRDSAASLCALLATYDYEVETAYDGWAAIAMLTRFRPHLILLDIGMPGLDGYGTCRIIREQTGEQQPKIIAVTGWGQEEDRRKSREAGFDAHLVKPLDPTSLLQLIEVWTADAA
jgi:PAS domain S-box-containing protein